MRISLETIFSELQASARRMWWEEWSYLPHDQLKLIHISDSISGFRGLEIGGRKKDSMAQVVSLLHSKWQLGVDCMLFYLCRGLC